jgi:hypothetical protein
MKNHTRRGLVVATLTAAALLAPAGATPAQASCTTVMIGDQKACLEQIPCGAREFVADQNEKLAPTIRKYVIGWCYT